MDEPTLNIKLSDYDQLRNRERSMQEQIYQLEAQLTKAQLDDATGTLALTHAALLDALQIIQFAVGNLPSESVTGWPHEALVRVADAIEKLPGIGRHMREVPAEFRDFARMAAGLEAFRKERDKNRIVVAATAADFGPQTDEARLVHAAHSKLGDESAT